MSRRDKILAQHPLAAYPYLLHMKFGKPTLSERINWFMAGLPEWLESLIAQLIAFVILFGIVFVPYWTLNHFGLHLIANIVNYAMCAAYVLYTLIPIVSREWKKRKGLSQ